MTSWASRRTLAADEVEVSGRVLGGTLQPGTPILRLEPTQHTCSFFPPSIFFVFIYLVVLGLSCSTWNLVPWTRIKLAPLNREYRVLATESLGKSPFFSFPFLFWLCWVFTAAHRISIVAAGGFLIQWLLLLWSTALGMWTSAVAAPGL